MLKHTTSALVLGLFAATAHGGAELPLAAVRVAMPAQLQRDGDSRTLLPRTLLHEGDRIVTGRRGRAALQLAGLGLVTLGADAELFVHSADLPPGNGPLARLQLVRGAVRIDARPKASAPAQDFRVNAGRLRMRVYGSEIWAEVTDRGENVCLLQGAIEILRDDGADRIDVPGNCLLFSGTRQHLVARSDDAETLARKLVRTAFAEDYTTRLAAQGTAAADAGDDSPPAAAAPAAVMPPPARPATVTPSVPARTPAAAAATGRWHVIVASLPDAATAEREAARLRAQGLELDVRSDGGHHRLSVGDFASSAEARKAADELKARYGVASPWLLHE